MISWKRLVSRESRSKNDLVCKKRRSTNTLPWAPASSTLVLAVWTITWTLRLLIFVITVVKLLMTNIVVDKSTGNAEPLAISFLPQYSTPKKGFAWPKSWHEERASVGYNFLAIWLVYFPNWAFLIRYYIAWQIETSMTRTALSRLLSTTENQPIRLRDYKQLW